MPMKVLKGVKPRLSPASVWPLGTAEIEVSKILPAEDAKHRANAMIATSEALMPELANTT
jgi:hypothetical protein